MSTSVTAVSPNAQTSGRSTPTPAVAHQRRRIPLRRLVLVELRKSFDTTSGLWLLASIAGLAILTSGAVIAFSPAEELTYQTFTLAIGIPISIILPVIAVLSVTAEWTQRSGLTTFTLVPHRERIVLAKALALVLVAAPSMLVAFTVGAVGHLLGSAITGTDTVWNLTWPAVAQFALGNTLVVLVGFTLGVLIRASAGALVAYFVYSFVAPPLLMLLEMKQSWFADLRAWIDPSVAQDALFGSTSLTGEQWQQLAVTTVVWLVLPLTIGVLRLMRAEVK
jgi:ABC-2 type transport system permease protein